MTKFEALDAVKFYQNDTYVCTSYWPKSVLHLVLTDYFESSPLIRLLSQ